MNVMKRFVLGMVIIALSACFSQYVFAQDKRTADIEDVDMISMKNFYAIDIMDVTPDMQEAIYNAYENCLIKEVYKSSAGTSPIEYKVMLETTDMQNLVVGFDSSGHVLRVMSESDFLGSRQR